MAAGRRVSGTNASIHRRYHGLPWVGVACVVVVDVVVVEAAAVAVAGDEEEMCCRTAADFSTAAALFRAGAVLMFGVAVAVAVVVPGVVVVPESRVVCGFIRVPTFQVVWRECALLPRLKPSQRKDK